MFSGIIQRKGVVRSVDQAAWGSRLVVDPGDWKPRPAVGDSIAVNGCCLTAARVDVDASTGAALLNFDVIHQTLRVTTLGCLRPGMELNLEQAATPTTLLGGHLVQGHVDDVGKVDRVIRSQAELALRIAPATPDDMMDHIVARGSIAVDGVSLTIASVGETCFEVALIPTTISLTTLGQLNAGDQVNLESDCIARMVAHWLRRRESAAPARPHREL